MGLESLYKLERDRYLVEIRVDGVPHLLDSLDPAPFRDRALDPQAEVYIVACAKDLGGRPMRLAVHLPDAAARSNDAEHLPHTIRSHFAYRAATEARELRRILAEGRISLVIGLSFLTACITLGEIVATLDGGWAGRILAEGLHICGWVAMWRPIQTFLYDWWPVRNRQRIFESLGRIEVEVRSSPSPDPL